MRAEHATPWPLELVLDAQGRRTGWAVLHAPVRSPDRMEVLSGLLRAGTRFVGMTSDGDFPHVEGHDPIDYASMCDAWCHCFREPAARLPPGAPQTLLSDSDFTDYAWVVEQSRTAAPAPRYDFVYVGATEPWKQQAKGWELALRCLPVLCGELGLRGLLVGTAATGIPRLPTVTLVPALPWPELLRCVAGARFLFAPNELDASPRVLAEALSLDVPVVVNRCILGGWKYITRSTGVFFDDERDVAAAVTRCLRGTWRPHLWFRSHHGPYLAGRRLLRLLREVDPSLSERSHLRLERRVGAAGRVL
jgi:glycosyltransferase involved in cell wall biosynthesis